jgi:hypothetical protein
MSLVSGFARMPKKIINNMTLPPSGVGESKEGVKIENEPIS